MTRNKRYVVVDECGTLYVANPGFDNKWELCTIFESPQKDTIFIKVLTKKDIDRHYEILGEL